MSKFSCLNVTNLFYQKLSGFSCKIFRLNEECILNRGTRLYICWKLHFSVDLPFQPELNLELILKIKDFFYSNQIHLKHSFSHIWDSFNYHKIREIILSCLKQIFIKHTSNHVCKVRLQKCCQQVSNWGQRSWLEISPMPFVASAGRRNVLWTKNWCTPVCHDGIEENTPKNNNFCLNQAPNQPLTFRLFSIKMIIWIFIR